ncbi:MAG: UDP-N-acetylglucosamine 2-epimerase (non-hydrolyzing) [Flavobacteriaceae bacterium]|nr:UDP-N-acetylglucosamine 2-epimerase (non-hydrolyzing) [Flavobacteriaceae bacterium]
MKKIVTIVGARPQLIKAAVLSRVISKYNMIEEIIVHTGQHFDANMSAIFFDEMQIPLPKYNLGISGLNHGAMTGQMLEKIEEVVQIEKPSALVVYGDTNSTIAGALAAKKYGIKVIHVEAGLRSFNMNMPEEINRVVTDRISDLLLCPTETAIQNLKNEGFDRFDVRMTNCGDIMKDAVEYYGQISSKKSSIIHDLNLSDFIVATIHRQENTNDIEKLKDVLSGLDEIHEECQVVMPLHPRTRKILKREDINPKITLIDPVGYFDMLELLKNCRLVITDSGGLQKEAFFNRKHCLVVRDETEWTELVERGYAKIVGSDKDQMIKAYNELKNLKTNFSADLYGTNVGEKIHQELVSILAET